MSTPNRIIGIAILGSLLVALTVSTAAQTKTGATRIRFKRGQTSTTIKGQLTSRRLERTFLVGAQAGQELQVQITARTSDGLDFAILTIYDPLGKSLTITQDSARIRLARTGDYRIEISPPGSFYRENVKGYKQMQFSLFVKIQ
jgi:hypothetical protein